MTLNEGPQVGEGGSCQAQFEKRLGFAVLKLGFEDLAVGPAMGSIGRGIGWSYPPRTASNTPIEVSTDFG